MTEIETEMLNILTSLGLENKITDSCKKYIIQEVENRFIEGNPRAWWMGLKNKEEYYFPNNSAPEHILDIIPKKYQDDIWFIIDEDNNVFQVYKFPHKYIEKVIHSCQYFEYYIISVNFDWIIAENDHGTLSKAKPKIIGSSKM